MANREQFAQWIVNNQNKKGTPEFDTVVQAFQKLSQASYEQEPVEVEGVAKDMSTGERFMAGMGKAVADTGRGLGQMIGLVSDEDVEESRKRDESLMSTTSGQVGNFGGNVAMIAPTAMIPGANTLTGAALIGGGVGALQPTAEDESRLKNTVFGAGFGLAGQAGANALSKALQRSARNKATLQATNAPRDRILSEGVESGYSVTPTQAGGGNSARLAQALSGKYKTEELARIRNQPVTNSLARRSVGLSDDTPITPQALKEVREQAALKGYTPVRNTGRIQVDDEFLSQLDDIAAPTLSAKASFPNAVSDDIPKMVNTLRVSDFDSGQAVDMISKLRAAASKAYSAGDSDLGSSIRKAASALEDQIERHLSNMGDDGAKILDDFREARTLIAKTHSLEKAVNQGGNVDAQSLASQLRRGKPLSNELRQIGEFGDQFRSVSRVPDGDAAGQFTIFDMGLGVGGSAATGNPAPMLLAGARPLARQAVLSRPVQKAMANKNYDPSLVAKLLQKPGAETVLRSLPVAGAASYNAN